MTSLKRGCYMTCKLEKGVLHDKLEKGVLHDMQA